jgi:ABC-2 type transport system ATP-binding protein
VYVLVGANGAGKSTLFKVLMNLERPDAGSAEVFGLDTRRHRMRIRRLLGYLPQQLSIDGQLTGYENVWLFTRLFDVPRRERRQRAEEALASMGLADVAGRLASTYSGGMVRRLELAQALVNRPALLVLDEPTVGLDPVARDSVWARVRQLQEEHGTTVLLTTHYMEEADALCDRVALMHHGTVRALGAPGELKAALGPEATLEDVFRHHTGDLLAGQEKGGLRSVRSTRRTAGRMG